MINSISLKNLISFRTNLNPVRFTWIFRHAYDIPATPKGQEQRPPHEKQIFQKYRIIENKILTTKMSLVPVILLKTVPGIGKAGEVIEIRSHMLREHYLPSGLAVYATDNNVKRYSHLLNVKEEKFLEAHEKLGIALHEYELFIYVNSKAIPILVSLEDPWTLEKWHLKANLRLQDLLVSEDQIIMDPRSISGPNLKLQNSLFRFYILVNRRLVMPCTGRYQHVTTKTYKQMLTPSLPDQTLITEEYLSEAGLIEEDLYVHPSDLTSSDIAIWDMMQAKMEAKRKVLEINPKKVSLRQQAVIDAETKKKHEHEIAELQRRTFTWKQGPRGKYKFLSTDEQTLARKLRKRHRNWDDDLHNWPEPLGLPRKQF